MYSFNHIFEKGVYTLCYLCCSEEDFLSNVSDGAGGDTQAHTGEDVGIVSLTREERPPIRQGDGVKWAATGKDAPPLQHIVIYSNI